MTGMHTPTQRPTRRALTALCVSALALAVAAPPALASSTPPAPEPPASTGSLQIILDSSGSMAAADPTGGTKIQAAGRALASVVDALPDQAVAGVRVYGGTYADKARGCQDSRLVVPLAPLDRSAAKRAFSALQPRGYTPIASSLQKAAADFTGEGVRRILLVSDGEETCGGDPCQVAKTLERSGIDLTVDTVGFAADAATKRQLACIATATGGTYTEAANGRELAAELSRSAIRAYRDYRFSGTPITGTPTATGAPAMVPGTYRDTLAAKTPKHYRIDVPEGVTPYIAASVVPPQADYPYSVYEETSMSLKGLQGPCGMSYSPGGNQGGGIVAVTNVLTVEKSFREDCTAAGPYDVTINRTRFGTAVADIPVEIVVFFEPPVTDVGELPPASLPVPGAPALPAAAKTAAPVTGGGSFTAAPLLDPGTFSDSLRPGESSYYRVPVGWGQRLNLTAVVSPAPDLANSNQLLEAKVHVYNPVRQVIDADGATSSQDYVRESGSSESAGLKLHAWTPPITYRNREADTVAVNPPDGSEELAGADKAGELFVQIELSDYIDKDLGAPDLLPVRLVVEVLGKESGAPAYAAVDGSAEATPTATPSTTATTSAPASPGPTTRADPDVDVDVDAAGPDDDGTSGSRTVAYVGGGVTAALLAGLLLLAPWLRRRRTPDTR